MNRHSQSGKYPKTVSEAVDWLAGMLSEDEELGQVTELDEFALQGMHLSLGSFVRSRFGLFNRNYALYRSCGTDSADEASAIIIEALWKKLGQGTK